MRGRAIYEWTSFIVPTRRCRLMCDKLRRSSKDVSIQQWITDPDVDDMAA